MSFHEIHSWALSELIRAFLDLAFVYYLLCVSAIVFIPSKILKLVGLCLPCPCTGFYGNQNTNLCFRRLIVDWPMRKIYFVLELVKGRFPFDLILIDDQMGNSNTNGNLLRENHHVDGVSPVQSEACCSTFSGSRLQNLVDKDSECDGKGKRIMYRRPRTKIQRRRRSAVEDGKLFPRGICEGNEYRKEREFVALVDRQEFIPDAVNESNHMELGENTWQGFESSGSVGENSHTNKGSSTIGQGTSNTQERETFRNEVSSIRLLKQALEEEKAARASLLLELEEERAAAATAANEAMNMMTRLQNEKASVEMEARQYQRVIEEKFAYDEEEMNILREILIEREIDCHVLEKEIETYRQMDFTPDERKEQSATTHYPNGDSPIHQIGFEKMFHSRRAPQGSLEHIDHTVNDLGSSILDMEMDVQDIHVIDEKLHMENTEEERKVDN